MRRGLLSSFVWTFAGKLGQQGSAFIVGALITRGLGTVGRGFFAEVQTWIGMAIALFGLSLDTAIYHFANQERYPVGNGVRLAITVTASLIAAFLAAGLMVAGGWLRPDKISPEAAAQLPLMFAAVVATVLATNLITLGQALGRVKLAAAVSMVQGAVNLAIVAAAFWAGEIDLRLALLAVVATQAIGATGAMVGFMRTERATFQGITKALLTSFVGAGLRLHIGTVAVFLYVRFNFLIVFHFCGAEETGLLATAWTLAFGLFGMLGSFQLALYPRVLHSSDDLEITIRSLRLGLYVGFLFVVPLLISAKWLLRWYGGSSFEAAAPTFRLMTLAAWVMFLASLAAPYLVKAGALLASSACAIVVGIASVGGNLLLVPRLQAEGGGMATLLAVTLNFALSLGLVALVAGKSPMAFLAPEFRAEWVAARHLLATLSWSRVLGRSGS